jgi:hypothetical protein
MAGAGPVGRSGIPGHANQPHLDLVDAGGVKLKMRQAHETWHTGKARHFDCRNRLKKGVIAR